MHHYSKGTQAFLIWSFQYLRSQGSKKTKVPVVHKVQFSIFNSMIYLAYFLIKQEIQI